MAMPSVPRAGLVVIEPQLVLGGFEATVTDPDLFSSGRQFAAWLGLTPQQHSTGGKTRLGGISKQGDRYLRRLLVVGATAVMRHVKDMPGAARLGHRCVDCWRLQRSWTAAAAAMRHWLAA